MGFRDRMNKKTKKFKKRINKGGREGGRFPTIFNKKRIPEGVQFYKCREGENIIDIIPFECGPDMPIGDNGEPITEEGDFDYVLDLFVHTNVGSLNKPYVCPYENFGKPCPICEYMNSKRLDKEEWKKIRAKRRSIYLVWDHTDRKSEKKGIQIFDAAHFFMEEKILEIARLPKGGGFVFFSNIDSKEGKNLVWTRKGTGPTDTQYLGHKFADRDSKIPDKILDSSFALDQVVNMHPSYEEIAKEFKADNPDVEEDETTGYTDEDEDIDDSGFERKKKNKKKKRKRSRR